jgi:twitching motility protein PilT
MNNIEKLLDAMFSFQGEKLVINQSEPPYVLKSDQKKTLRKSTLAPQEFILLQKECEQFFLGSSEASYNERTLVHDMATDRIVIRLLEEKPLQIAELLELMVEKRASDLHLSSGCKPRVRIDGDIIVLKEYVLLSEKSLWQELEKITPAINDKEFQESHDTDFAHDITGLARFRVNIFRDHRGIGVVFRQIPTQITSAESIGIPEAVVGLCDLSKGLVLVTGPTGSGKSTTLSALIDHINSNQKKHIITVEDPVEFVHQNKRSLINQREIKTHTASFKKALRAALREDPDVILVGEMRDLETIAIAIEMAVTGHLVFGTLHTATAMSTIDRVIDQFPSDQQNQIRTMLADALLGVVAQMLCKKKEGGRVAAYEVLIVTPGISNIIREGKTFQIATMMQTGKALGMKLLNDSLAELVDKGVIDSEEALSKAIDRENLKNRLKSKAQA